MQDLYSRTIDYLRVSVTDRCNFRCVYCMPPEGVEFLSHQAILRYEEMLRLIQVAVWAGIKKVRLTGGEPLVRKGIVQFVEALANMRGIEDLSMTTNGSLLPELAKPLKDAGLQRINISLDTANPMRFHDITGKGKLDQVWTGIESALAVGFKPLKINVTLTHYFQYEDLNFFLDLVSAYPIHVRFIEYMPIGDCRVKPGPTIESLKEMINSAGKGLLVPDMNHPLGYGPARYYKLPGAKGSFGFITPISDHFCPSCNRIRLTADGKLKPCLLSNQEIDMKLPLRAGADDLKLFELFCQAIEAKPSQHHLCPAGSQPEVQSAFQRQMSQIGG